MPTVPRSTRQVQTAGLPGVRKTAAETDLSTGAGLEEARARKWGAVGRFGQTIGEVGAMFGQMAQHERQRADEVALMDAENRLSEWENQRLYDPANGALAQKGKDALPLPETVKGEFDEMAGEVEKSLGTDRQREAFAKLKLNRQAGLDLTLRRHVYQEMQRYEGQELEATVKNAQNAAVQNATDPRRVGLELGRAVDAIQRSAPRLGFGPEQVKQQIDATTSSTHVGVIERLLADDQSKTAQVYFDETRGQINGDAIARIEKALNEGKTRKEAQTKTDEILAAGGTLTEQRNKAKAIDDPDVRDAVTQRLEHESIVAEKAKRDEAEGTLRGVYDIVDKTGDVARIPPATWANLDGSTRSAIISYRNQRAAGKGIDTDLPTYYGLMQSAASDPDKFALENLLQYRAKLGEAEFKQLANLQLSMRNGDRNKAEKELGGFRTNNQILEDSLTAYGLNPNPKANTAEAGSIAQLRRMLDTRVQALEQLTGKKPTNDDIQKTLDGLLSQSHKIEGSFWNLFTPGPVFDRDKRLIDLQPADVPAKERADIEGALRRKGRPVSDATVLDAYIEQLSRERR